jgi:hypothetical protein
VGTKILSGGKSDGGVIFTFYFSPEPSLRRSGTMPLHPLYAFMAWTKITLAFRERVHVSLMIYNFICEIVFFGSIPGH